MRLVSDFYDSNVFVLEKGDQALIVDCGVEPSEIQRHLKGKKVVGVLLTHGHFDHAVYSDDYAKTLNTKVYASEMAKEYLADHKKNYSTDFEGLFFEIKNFQNFVFLSGDGEFVLGDFKIKYKQLGGHSKGDMIYEIDNEIFVGDILLGRDMGRVDLYGGNKIQMKQSLEVLLNEDYTIMHSGHGEDNDKKTQDKVIKIWTKFLSR